MRRFPAFLALIILAVTGAPLARAAEGLAIRTLGKYSRLVIPALPSTGVTATGQNGKIQIKLERSVDLSRFDMAALVDSRVQKVDLISTRPGEAQLDIRLARPGADFFAWAQTDPPAIVVDIWENAAPKVVAAAPVKQKPAARSPASVAEKVPHPEEIRIAPISRESSVIPRLQIPMPVLTLKGTKVEVPSRLNVEDHWAFSRGNPNAPDGEAFNFALKLYKEKKFGLTLRTIELMERDHPKTKHRHELTLLRGFSLKKLAEEKKTPILLEQADNIFQELAVVKDDAGRPLPFQKVLLTYFTMKEYQTGTAIRATEMVEALIKVTDVADPDYLNLQMVLADLYVKLNRARAAERIFRFIVENHPKHPLAADAAYRTADLLATENNYSRVVEEGEEALRRFPEHKKVRPEVVFNLGEAWFWKGNNVKSEKYFQDFTREFPQLTEAGMAWARLGEIAEIERKDLKTAEERYQRAKDGFPYTFGDMLATLRLARIRIAREKNASYQVSSVESILKDKMLDPTIRRMAELALVDGYLVSNQTDRAIAVARKGMLATNGAAYEDYKDALARSLFKKLQELNEKKSWAEALALYDRERGFLALAGPKVFWEAAKTYQGLGLYDTANGFLAQYGRAQAGRSPASQQERGRLALDRAENGFRSGNYEEVIEVLNDVPASVERDAMRAVALHRLNRKKEAWKEGEKVFQELQEKAPHVARDVSVRWMPLLGDILVEKTMEERDWAGMQSVAQKVNRSMDSKEERFQFFEADALWYAKKHKEAIAAYTEALKSGVDGERSDRARYNMAMSHIALRNREEAVKLLALVKEKQRGVWGEAAQRELDLLDWEKKYSSVLRTLPPSGLGVAQ